jgi:glycosyltransferase involved in cell wall biosynthesis
MSTMRLHLVGFPHTRLTAEFSTCAYTQKVVKFARMAATHGWDLTVYATQGSEVPDGVELVECLTDRERVGIFGADDPNSLPAWPSDEQWALFNTRATAAVKARAGDRDLLLLPAGWSQRQIQAELPNLVTCEPGVGYEGILPVSHCAFESAAWQHHVYGLKAIRDGRWFDAVIPNYFDPDEFPFSRENDGDLLYVGRLIARKGVHVAAQIAEACGRKLLVAGPGCVASEDGLIVMGEGVISGPVEYIGTLNVEERAEAMGNAAALICPTGYIEPFGGVAVEAMLCGTPVVATPWGAFTETVEAGVSGYHFHTLQEGVDAVERAIRLVRDDVREYALSLYSLDAVAPLYERWFGRLETLWDGGWYERTEAAECV